MEAWRQYRAFTLDQEPATTTTVTHTNTSVANPASSATTLREPIRTSPDNQKEEQRKDDSSSPSTTPNRPVPTSAEKPPLTLLTSPTSPTLPTYVTSPTLPTYVSFLPSDPSNPQNWSSLYKAWVVFLLSFLTLSLTFASSASSSAEIGVMEEFGCGEIAATAMTGVFLVGMGLGAMPAAPLSECTSVSNVI